MRYRKFGSRIMPIVGLVSLGFQSAEAQSPEDFPVFDVPEQAAPAQPEYIPGRIVVKYRDTNGIEALSAQDASALGLDATPIRQTSGGETIYQLDQRTHAELQALSSEALRSRVVEIIATLNERDDVEYAVRDVVGRHYAPPADPFFDLQWHFGPADPATGGIDMEAAWDRTTGNKKITIAVLDTGLVAEHPDISVPTGGIVGRDFISDPTRANDGDGRDDDPTDPGDACNTTDKNSWHGTHVAGTVGVGISDNDLGLAGINWLSNVISVRVLGRCGGAFSDINDAIRWAAGIEVDDHVNPNPAQVINMSLGAAVRCSDRPDMQEAINNAVDAGALVVVAAGNESSNVAHFSPAGCENVLTVAASDFRGHLVERYSNFGDGVDILAPGGDVTRDDNSDNFADGVLSYGNPADSESGAYVFKNGTSMAAPHVAGVAALLLSQNPGLTAQQVEALLIANARPRTPVQCPQPCGAGLLNADIDVNAAPSSPGSDALPAIAQAEDTVDFGDVREFTNDPQIATTTNQGAVTPSALSGRGFTYRHDWGDKNGQWKLTLNWPQIQASSRVFAAAGECRAGGGNLMGAARYTVHNVVPKRNGIGVWLNIEWREPIRVCVDYFVVNP